MAFSGCDGNRREAESLNIENKAFGIEQLKKL
jgi:hypothetical protein